MTRDPVTPELREAVLLRDKRPRQHLLGWGEIGPNIVDMECEVCGAPPNKGHRVVMLGVYETLSILNDKSSRWPRAMVEPL